MTSADEAGGHAPETRGGGYHPEDMVALILFWALAVVVFLQFFTRYALNSSLAWTEEIARYLLIGTAFAGAGMAARKNSHIFVAWFYQFVPPRVRRMVRGSVYLASALFYGLAAWLSYRIVELVQERMVSVDLPFWILYAVACAGFTAIGLRTLQVARGHFASRGEVRPPGGRRVP